ncbi:MAG TPA: homoaconitase [Phycisphaerales bacterium]|nr:homoaconitase [Phycisphaerales bacterium]
MPLTLVEKLATHAAVGLGPGEAAWSGRIVRIRPKHVMTHDNTAAVIPKFLGLFEGTGRTPRVYDPRQPVFAIDHDIQNVTPENLGKYARIARFAAEHGIDHYPPGTGISHQVMVEQGYVTPGSMVLGSDSHSNLYGALCCLGTPIVRTDAACLWATGTTWWRTPRVARCVLRGRLRPGVVGKDVIIALCGVFNRDEVLNHAVEFEGDGVASLSMDQRMTIANMTTEWGALAGVFPFDGTLRDYLLARAAYFAGGRRPGTRRQDSQGGYTREDVERWWERRGELTADDGATYHAEMEVDLSTVVPHVSGPNGVKVMHSLPEMERRRVRIQKAYLLSCVNARLEDLAEAASVVRGRRVAEGVEFYVAAASAEVQREAERLGYWRSLLDAGAIALPSGCGPCIGLGAGLVRDGEVAISATNRNFRGRMGSRDAEVFLGSPAVVAASAIAGFIRAPGANGESRVGVSYREGDRPTASQAPNGRGALVAGFPGVIRADTVFLPRDDMDTDGIFAGKHTYNEALAPEQMAAVVFENYDPEFGRHSKRSDVIVSGRNFGTGSSREQAATALKYRGVPCVVAASFSETYLRNAFNNGLPCVECPGFVEALHGRFPGLTGGTVRGPAIEIDFGSAVVRCEGEEYGFMPLSPVAQELVAMGGAESMTRAALGAG